MKIFKAFTVALLALIASASGLWAQATLEVSKSIKNDLTSVETGKTFSYIVQYSSSSTQVASFENAYIIDQLPPELEFLDLQGTTHIAGHSYNNGTGELRIDFVNPLGVGLTGEIQIDVRFKSGSTLPGTTIENTVTSDADNAAPFTTPPVSITATATDKVSASKSLVGSSVPLDQPVTFRVQTRNGDDQGALDAQNVTMVDRLPTGAVFVSANGGGVYDPVEHTVTWTRANVSAGSTWTQLVTMTFPSTTFAVDDNIINNVDVTYTPVGGSETQTTAACPHEIVAPDSDGRFWKSVQNAYVYEGKEASKDWNFGIQNKGNVPMENVTLVDYIPNEINVENIRTGEFDGTPSGLHDDISVFYQTNLTGSWIAAPGNPYAGNDDKTINVSDLGLAANEYITAIKWEFGTIPANYEIDNLRFRSTILTVDRDGNALVVGDQVRNVGTLTWNDFEKPDYNDPHSPSDDAVVDIRTPQPVARLYKDSSPSTVNDGDTTTYNVRLDNRYLAARPLQSPVIADLLDAKLVYVPNSATVTNNPAGWPAPVLEVIEDYKGTGRTLLRWSWPGQELDINDKVEIEFQAHIPRGTIYGRINNEIALVDWANAEIDTQGVSSEDDDDDLDGDNLTNERIYTKNDRLTVRSRAEMESVKWVKGQLDTDWSKYPVFGLTVPGGKADYRLIIENTGNVPIVDPEILDILPIVGDTGVVDLSQRGTDWLAALATTVDADPSVKVYYSRSANPERRDYVSSGPPGADDPLWNLVAPATLVQARSLLFVFDGVTLAPGESYELTWSMRAPVGTPTSNAGNPNDANYQDWVDQGIVDQAKVAWNSFAYFGTREDTGSQLLAAEPNQVGIAVQADENAGYGDRVWLDVNRDGIQDPGEVGLNGIKVHLFQDSGPNLAGDGIQDPANDLLIGTTVTADNFFGEPGYYLFPNLDRGAYYAVFEFPDGYGISPDNVGSDAAVDSNGVLTATTDPQFDTTRIGITAITELEAQEQDLTWDQGLWLPPTSIDIVKTSNGIDDGVNDYRWNFPGDPITYTYVVTNTGDLPLVRMTVTDDKLGLVGYIDGPLQPGHSATLTKTANIGSPVTNIGTVVGYPADVNGNEIPGGPEVTANDDAQIRLLAGVGDKVWIDLNGNQVQDGGEPGVPNVPVRLYDSGGNLIDSATTNGSGKYLFKVYPGSYYVEFDPPANYYVTPADGGPEGQDSDMNPATGRTATFTLAEGQIDRTWDLGLWQPASLGDYVWIDQDQDGLQDNSETGLNGVVVNLLDAGGDPVLDNSGAPITTTTANDSGGQPGYYEFTNLYPDTYAVEFERPERYRFTQFNADGSGINGAHNSDAEIGTGRTTTVTLAPGEHNPRLDAGVYLFNPVISLVKNASISQFDSLGQQIVYTFTVKNEGNVPLTDVVVTDPLITVTGGPIDLDIGQSDNSTFSGVYTVTQADIDAGERPNTATATGKDPDGEPVTDDSSVIVDADQIPGIAITKTGTFSAKPGVCGNVLGIGNEFNAFIYGDLVANGGDTDARLAVAGDAEIIGGYSVGVTVKGDPQPTRTDGLVDMLIVGGNLTDGNWRVNGNIVYGGTRVGPQRHMQHGNLIRQVFPVTFDAAANVLDDGSGTTFRDLAEEFALRSAMLAAVADRGVVSKDVSSPHNLVLVGNDPELNVFNLTAAEWNSENRSLDIIVPDTATVLINVTGSNISMVNAGMNLNGLDRRQVLYNYVNATHVETTNFAHLGSVLAPYATGTFSAGSIDGRALFGGDVHTSNGFEFHNFPFTGNICLEVAYELTVSNTGNVTLSGVAIDDPLVPVTGGPITLAPGDTDTDTFTAVLEPKPFHLVNGKLINTATVSATAPLGDGIDAEATHELPFALFGSFPSGGPGSVTTGGPPAPSGGKPQFEVTAIHLSADPLSPGADFDAQVTVINKGNASGNSGVLRLWIDKHLNALVGESGEQEMTIGQLEIGESRTVTFTGLTAPSPLGSYFLRAFIDADDASTESDENDNQKSLEYTVSDDPAAGAPDWMKPDFVLNSIQLSPVPQFPGDVFSATVTVTNQGDIPGDAGILRAWIDLPGAAAVGQAGDFDQSLGVLGVGESVVITFTNITAPAASATYQFRAFVDADDATEEYSSGNNQLTRAYWLDDPDPAWKKADFIVQSVTLEPSPTILEAKYNAVVRVTNVGHRSGNAGQLAFWSETKSWNNLPATPDQTVNVGTLDPGQSKEFRFDDLRAPGQMGTYHVRAIVDHADVTEEYSSGNNSGGNTYTVFPLQAEIEMQPDGSAKISWNSAGGYTYTVERSVNMGPFTEIATGLDANPPTNEWTDTNPPSGGITAYRVWGTR